MKADLLVADGPVRVGPEELLLQLVGRQVVTQAAQQTVKDLY